MTDMAQPTYAHWIRSGPYLIRKTRSGSTSKVYVTWKQFISCVRYSSYKHITQIYVSHVFCFLGFTYPSFIYCGSCLHLFVNLWALESIEKYIYVK